VPVVAEDIASLDFDLDLGETPVATAEVTPVETALKAPSDSGLDFDLDLDEPAPSPDAKTSAEAATSDIAALDIDFDLNMPDEAVAPASGSQDSNAISFDLDLPTESQALALDINVEPPVTEVASVLANEAPVLPVAADANNIDFALDLELPEVSQATEIIPNEVTLEPLADEPVPAVPKMDDAASIDFDFDLDLGESTPPVDVADVSDSPLTTVAERGTELPEPQSFAPPLDLGSISLDLDSPEPTPVPEPLANAGVIEDAVPDNPESATKLELALAYEEMGDSDGARELLEEVLKEGSPGQREAAQAKLDTLG
jgi:pilus assembly protein FimV